MYIKQQTANGVLSWVASLTVGVCKPSYSLVLEPLLIMLVLPQLQTILLEMKNTGAVQIDGGVGIAKNLTVKENLHVGGYAEFVGVVTFKGGTINIGDNNTDDINVGGEFISGLVPNVDDTHDLGITTQRWRTLNVVNVNATNLTVQY
jgi:hypothetical protein